MRRLHSGAPQDVSLLQYNAAASTAKKLVFWQAVQQSSGGFHSHGLLRLHSVACKPSCLLCRHHCAFSANFFYLKKIQCLFLASKKPVEQFTIALTCVLLLT